MQGYLFTVWRSGEYRRQFLFYQLILRFEDIRIKSLWIVWDYFVLFSHPNMLGLLKSSLRCIRTFENFRSFHAGGLSQGFNEFYDVKVPGEPLTTGRAWSLADVRRKVRYAFFTTVCFSICELHLIQSLISSLSSSRVLMIFTDYGLYYIKNEI